MKLTKNHEPALDGLRGIAIILVIISHFGLKNFVPGGFGVNLFFFISGLLITRLMLIEYHEKGEISLKAFFARRILRLYPALLFFISICILYLCLYGYQYLNIKEIIATLFYYRNYFPYLTEYNYPPKEFNVFHIVWSLAIEEHFYIVFPFLFVSLIKRPKLFIGILCILIITALMWRLNILNSHRGLIDSNLRNRIHYLTDTRFDAMLYGCLMSLLLFQSTGARLIKFIGNKWVMALALSLIVLSVVIRSDAFRESWRYSIQGIAFFIIIPSILHNNLYSSIKKFFSTTWLIKIGKLSYSLYLFHWLGLCIASHFHSYNRTNLVWLTTAVSTTIVLSLISYHCIEIPTIRLRKRFGSNASMQNSLNLREENKLPRSLLFPNINISKFKGLLKYR